MSGVSTLAGYADTSRHNRVRFVISLKSNGPLRFELLKAIEAGLWREIASRNDNTKGGAGIGRSGASCENHAKLSPLVCPAGRAIIERCRLSSTIIARTR
jgi:hypothetical protein